jgi:histone H3
MARIKGSGVGRRVVESGGVVKKNDDGVVDGVVVDGAVAVEKIRKKRRYRAGTVALRSIRKVQKSGKRVCAAAPLRFLARATVRDVGEELFGNPDLRITKNALDALHDASEAYLVGVLRLAGCLGIHAGRLGMKRCDLRLARVLVEDTPTLESQCFL